MGPPLPVDQPRHLPRVRCRRGGARARGWERIAKIKVRPKSPTPDVRARVSFRVRSGGEPAQGRFVIRKGKRVLAKGELNAKGKATARIKRLKAGKHRLKIVYRGSAEAARATKNKTITVRRR